jgi:hypothetical protein
MQATHGTAGASMGVEDLIPLTVAVAKIGDSQVRPAADYKALDNSILAASVADRSAIHDALLFNLGDYSMFPKHNKVAGGLSHNTGS